MNILITGATGQLGQDCCTLLKREHTIHGLSSGQLDITNREAVAQTVATLQPELIINCGAWTKVDLCESEKDACFRVNRDGPANLARAAAETGCSLIHISTDYVFDGTRPISESYGEDDPTKPLSVYGQSKLAGEQAVQERLDCFLIIRTAWLYGMGGSNFLKTILRLALQDPGRTLKVVDDQYGSLTWTGRLAHQINSLLHLPITGIVHATATGRGTWYAAARLFLETMDIPFSLIPCTTDEYPTPAPRPANSILDNRRLRLAGLDCMQPWRDDLEKFVRQYRDQLLTEAQQQAAN